MTMRRSWWSATALVALLALAALSAVAASAASASFSIASFGGAARYPDGSRATAAGAHADVTTEIAFSTRLDELGNLRAEGNFKNVHVELPAGLVGDPNATPRCTPSQLRGTGLSLPLCAPESQIGVVDLGLGLGGPDLSVFEGWPVYNMPAPPGVAAQVALNVYGVIITLDIGVSSAADHHLVADIRENSQGLPISLTRLTLWGVPADPVHDAQRYPASSPIPGVASTATRRPFMTLPTACSGTPLTARMSAVSWQAPDDVQSASFDHDFDGLPLVVEDCEGVAFDPRVQIAATSRQAGAPTGLDVEIAMPQTFDNPDGRSTSHLRDVRVTLPEGMALNPAAADGLEACPDDRLGLGGEGAAACPDASRIGSVEVTTPLLEQPLGGSVYLRPQASDDPESGDMFRLALVVESQERGISITVPGRVKVDPRSGRVVAEFDDNPQLPLSRIRVRLDGGARASLVNPPACGTHTARAELTPWSSPQTVVSDSSMVVDQGCEAAASFAPSLKAGATNAQAGGFTSFAMRLSRPDGQQELGALNASLPAGLLAVLKSVPQCSAARGAAGTCGAESRVGRVDVAAGAGSAPVWLPVPGAAEQSVSLTEPYRRDDVAGMSIVVPAKAGPFMLGTVVTRVFLRLRPKDQGVDLQTDPLPRVVGGVPVAIRELAVTVDRAGFMVNPTSCSAKAISVTAFSQRWVKAPLTSRFQAAGCAGLPLSPVIAVQGGGKGETARYRHPSLRVTVRQAAGQAHLSKADVVLPRAFNVDLQAPSLKAACPREVYAQDRCSKVATVGTVRAVTPLLAEPLAGPAFLLQKKGELPDIVMRLRNSQMSLDLIGVLDFLGDGRIITRVKGIPDAALSSFELSIRGGKGGSLLTRSDLCAKRAVTQATFLGQSAKVSVKTPTTRILGCSNAAASRTRAVSRHASVVAGVVHDRAIGGRS